MHRFLCVFGLHRWEKWDAPQEAQLTSRWRDEDGTDHTWTRPGMIQRRTCLCCGKFTWRAA